MTDKTCKPKEPDAEPMDGPITTPPPPPPPPPPPGGGGSDDNDQD